MSPGRRDKMRKSDYTEVEAGLVEARERLVFPVANRGTWRTLQCDLRILLVEDGVRWEGSEPLTTHPLQPHIFLPAHNHAKALLVEIVTCTETFPFLFCFL